MATIRVHEDQENRVTEIRRGKENTTVPLQNQTQQQKRAVLGVLHNNCVRNTKPVSFFDAILSFKNDVRQGRFIFHGFMAHYMQRSGHFLYNIH